MGDVIALHRFHKALRHAVALRTAHWRGQQYQADFASKDARLFGGVRRAVIAQPLNLSDRQCLSKTFLDGFKHDVTDVVTAVATLQKARLRPRATLARRVRWQ